MRWPWRPGREDNVESPSRPAYPTVRPYAGPVPGRRARRVPERPGRVYVPLDVMRATSDVMRRHGRERREAYVWWGGYFLPDGDAQVVTALYPDVPTEHGRVHLDHQNLIALHERLRALDLVLVAELHTHPPGAGGQNDVDAANAAATYRGFVTIVVPDFAAPILHDLRTAYVYEYEGGDQWRELTETEIEGRFLVEEPFHEVNMAR